MFRKKWTNWIPFGNYAHAETAYIVFVSKNKKTGIMRFKTKRVHGRFAFHTQFVPVLIDVKEAWNKICNM
jgi:hypothetical protein